MTNPITRLFKAASAFAMRWSGLSYWSGRSSWGTWMLGATSHDWRREAGDGSTNAAVIACIKAIQRAFPEAPMQVLTRAQNGDLTPQHEHAMMQLLERPNPHYSGHHLWAATVADFALQGNAYWIKVRSGQQRVVELWWVPSSTMEPRWPDDGSAFISHYDYMLTGQVAGGTIKIDPADVVHFRDGFDPDNVRKGLSPLRALFREVATDNEAANWSASLLRNMGVPGVVISPEGDVSPSEQDLEDVKTKFVQRFGGDNRGQPLVMKGPTKVSVLSFNPEQMKLTELRRVPEERISAAIGVPAIVAGLGVGLDHATYSNVGQAREAFYEQCLIPMQRLLAAEIQLQLVRDFGDPVRLRVRFDLSDVRVLQADENALANRMDVLVRAGIYSLNEAREALGDQPIDGGDVHLIPGAWAPTPPSHLAALLAAPAPDPNAPAQLPPNVVPMVAPDQQQPATRPAKALAPPAETKSQESIIRELQQLHSDVEPDWIEAAVRGLSQSAERIRARLAAGGSTADDLVPEVEAELFGRHLEPLQLSLLREVNARSIAELGVQFDLDDPLTRQYLRDAQVNLTGVTDTTREQVRAELLAGQEAGESVEQLAERIVSSAAFSIGRSTVIARTELGHAMNTAALANYRASGVVVGVRVFDGDYDAACAAMNGRVFALGHEPATLQHPNCRRAFAPVIEAA